MEISIADQRILLFTGLISQDEAQKIAWDKKTSAFDAFSKLGSFLSRPKTDDFELIYHEHRYEPFWHVEAHARYEYERNSQYRVAVSGKEVQKISDQNTDFNVSNGYFQIPFLEHCLQEEQEVVFVDGISGKSAPELKSYLTFPVKHVNEKENIEKLIDKDSILVPPQTRVSALMRDALAKMIKGINADKIIEESVKVDFVDLYYRPIYAYQYRWISKGKEAIVEVDALTGKCITGSRLFKEYLGKMLDRDLLFDIGKDVASLIVPGGGIAVAIAKQYTNNRNSAK